MRWSRILFLGLFLSCSSFTEQNADASLSRLLEIQHTLVPVHSLFEKSYPIALVYDGQYHIYEADTLQKAYKLVKTAPVSGTLPDNIMAAMPVEAYDWKMICVITPAVFKNKNKLPFVFHEFVHIYQWNTVEKKLKSHLSINQKAMAEKHYSWEIDWPFPYEKTTIAELYRNYVAALKSGKAGESSRIRHMLRQALTKEQWEYMCWEEWKEGMARFVENKVRDKLHLQTNDYTGGHDLNRIWFYAGGDYFLKSNHVDIGSPAGMERAWKMLYASGE